MPATKSRFIWPQTSPKSLHVHVAACDPCNVKICASPNKCYLLRKWQIRLGGNPLLFWKDDGYSLEKAQARAERPADQRLPLISR